MDPRSTRIVHFPAEVDVNPYTRLLYGALARHGFELVPDAELAPTWLWRYRRTVGFLHFHWTPNDLYEWRWGPAPLRVAGSSLGLGWFAVRLRLARLLGYRIVWTVHEVYPHVSASRRLDRIAGRLLARRSHVLMAHDRATARRVETELGVAATTITVVPVGSYAGVYPPGRARDAVREELAVPPDAFVFLAFGSMKPYKRLDLLLEAFRWLDLPEARLLVVGNVREQDAPIGEAVRVAAEHDPRITPVLGLVPDERVAELFDASDAVVLSRADGWTSSVLVLALGEGRPVVAARTSLYEELTNEGAAGWLFEPGDAGSLRETLAAAAADPELAREKGIAAARIAARLSWEKTAELTARLLLAR